MRPIFSGACTTSLRGRLAGLADKTRLIHGIFQVDVALRHTPSSARRAFRRRAYNLIFILRKILRRPLALRFCDKTALKPTQIYERENHRYNALRVCGSTPLSHTREFSNLLLLYLWHVGMKKSGPKDLRENYKKIPKQKRYNLNLMF